MAGMVVAAALATAAVCAACMAVIGLTVMQWNGEQLKQQAEWQEGTTPASATPVESTDGGGGVDGLPVRLSLPPCMAVD